MAKVRLTIERHEDGTYGPVEGGEGPVLAAPEAIAAPVPAHAARRALGIHPFTWFVIAGVAVLACDQHDSLLGPFGMLLRAVPFVFMPLWFVHDNICMHFGPALVAVAAGIIAAGAMLTGVSHRVDKMAAMVVAAFVVGLLVL